ncbi:MULTISPECIES: zinc-dependent alcohol dehydrogenase [Kamptonema]|uniref:zinc-dependent alcohol dehydrogenase n=1 Tax=Kamptonema TaxID=1501433 RepID=UPI0001DACE17|nr:MULTISPECIES: alcohol dehydrogenase catalytic domain-containing protein [Kamptonema]CBN58160.1 putative L-threonine 3-dehydrogenase [Kamptonema sp. PCC 6506]
MKALLKKNGKVSLESIPKPKSYSDNDVLIEVKTAGLCRTDIYVAEGKVKSIDPLILGHEFAGIIQEIGKNVSNLRSGNRVTVNPQIPCSKCHICTSGKTAYCQNTSFLGIHLQGAFAEYATVPASAVHLLPENVDFKMGAYTEPIAASLAVLKANIAPHETGLIYGDNRISQLTHKILKAYGFEDVTIYDAASDRELKPDYYDFIIETLVTSEALNAMLQALRPGGKIILKSRQHQPVALNVNQILKKEPIFHAVNYGSFEEALYLMASGQIDLDDILGEEFELEDFETVFSAAKQGESRKLFFRF